MYPFKSKLHSFLKVIVLPTKWGGFSIQLKLSHSVIYNQYNYDYTFYILLCHSHKKGFSCYCGFYNFLTPINHFIQQNLVQT